MQQGDLVRSVDLVDAMIAAADPRITDEFSAQMERSACPTCGSCSGMFTANSMNCLMEALGLALPGNGTIVATHADRKQPVRGGRAPHRGPGAPLLRAGRRPHPAARHRHLRGLRERHGARHRDGRIHQHRAPPAGRRARGGGALHHARYGPPLAPRAASLQGGAFLARRPRGGRSPRRRRLRNSGRTGSRRPAASRRAHRARADPGRRHRTVGRAKRRRGERARNSIAPRPAAYAPPSRSARAGAMRPSTWTAQRARSAMSRTPSARMAASPCCTATSPKTAAS